MAETVTDGGVYFADVYERLAAEFDEHHQRQGSGDDFVYISGEQCVSRLNEVLGVGAWDFIVKQHGVNVEADECWVLGRLEATVKGHRVVKEQFGSQKLKRSRSTGVPMDIGFDLKGAATDAEKKCATLLGVGLYLSDKARAEEVKQEVKAERSQAQQNRAGPQQRPQQRQQAPQQPQRQQQPATGTGGQQGTAGTPAEPAPAGGAPTPTPEEVSESLRLRNLHKQKLEKATRASELEDMTKDISADKGRMTEGDLRFLAAVLAAQQAKLGSSKQEEAGHAA